MKYKEVKEFAQCYELVLNGLSLPPKESCVGAWSPVGSVPCVVILGGGGPLRAGADGRFLGHWRVHYRKGLR